MKIITVEEHFSVPGTSAVEGMGASAGPLGDSSMDGGLVGGADQSGLSIDDHRVVAMDAAGVDVQVLSSPETRPDRVGETNDYASDAIRRYPGRFSAFATLPWTQPEAAAAELKRCVDDLGFVGAFVTNRVEDEFLDAERFDPILKTAVNLGVPINIHPGLPPEAIRTAAYGGLSPMVSAVFSSFGYGWHVDTGTHALHLILSGVFDRYPDLQLILGHWGELIPYYLPRLEDRMPPRVTGLKRRITDYVIDNIHISPSGIFDYRNLQLCIQMLGVERILYAVDYPIMGLEEARPFLENAPIPDADKEKIAHGNAERLLRL
ncbi:amidohydrolase family protein [Leifsonia sp. McL0607]|uniref:amidohydrolase family protein n=1 Tax=Leifsonia sp. McL0607 TaxID=3415672 RepID=UPI003CF316AE